MSGNKTFFKKAGKGQMSFGEIFSDVAKKHSSKDIDRLFISGTELTTPRESEMLAGWQKPFLFARFFLGGAVVVLAMWLLYSMMPQVAGAVLCDLIILMPVVVPVTLLLLAWELNIPRNISLLDIIKMVMAGALISFATTFLLNPLLANLDGVMWAGLVEEPAKLLAVYLIVYKKNYKYSINGLLVGMAVGTGFAVLENIAYVVSSCLAGSGALETAIVRSLGAISCSHGIWSALYGYALVKAKGSKKLEPSALVNPQFLMFLAISIGLHVLNNSVDKMGLPQLYSGLTLANVFISIAAIAVLFYILKPAVNQVVTIATQHNEGRVTAAVARESSAPVAAANPAAASGYLLQCVAGPNAGQAYRLHSGRSLTIGRASGRNDIALPGCDNVSGNHCRIDISGSTVTVTDLGSTNGTYLDARRLTPHQPTTVAPGATFYLGNKTCAFRLQRN